MRLQRLDLIRYGKFTDRSVALAAPSEYDFHLILGPNEAGKSTLRGAILDLLFGFHPRTPLDFVHAKSDLRLGAVVQQGDQALDFLRLKANKNTLRAPDETPLPDTALNPFLNGATRAFFDKMFGLDHPRLVQGGNSILNAQDDVGQILFQSAAGLASLGRVRDALDAEADSLWAPTRSMKRAYYLARADMDAAVDALKNATVHTRKWADAHELVQALAGQLQAQRSVLTGQQTRRDRLERIRRVSPVMRELNEGLAQLAGLGEVVSLAPDAAQTLEQAQRAQAVAQHGLQFRHAELQRLKKAFESINIDNTLLGLRKEIDALDAQRHQVGNHPSAMERHQGQLLQLAHQAMQQLNELGLEGAQDRVAAQDGQSIEQTLRSGLPALPVRKHTERLLRDHGALSQAFEVARAAQRERKTEVDAIEARLHTQPVTEVSTELRGALERAKALGDTAAATQKAQLSVQKNQAALEQALSGLGEWSRPVEQLVGLALPSAPLVAAWLAERRDLLSGLRSAAQRRDELAAAADKGELRLQQYREQHHPATQQDLAQARERRNAAWQSIKQGGTTLADAAEPFEALLHKADALADQRYEKAQEAAHMQSLQHQWEQACQDLRQARQRYDAGQQALDAFDAQWLDTSAKLGLAGLTLEQTPDWLVRKDRVLETEQALMHARQDLAQLQEAQQAALDGLAQALIDCGSLDAQTAYAQTLDGLRVRAEAYSREADAAGARQEAWEAQAIQARLALEAAQQALNEAQARKAEWQQAWSDAMTQIGLAPDTSPGAAEGALVLMTSISDKLEQMRRLRSERLDLMQAELHGFVAQAARLAHAAGLECASADSLSYADAFDMSQTLAQRLAQASRAQEEAAKLDHALTAERAEIRIAEQTLQEARAAIQPLMDRAGVDTLEALGPAISKSDQHRVLAQRVEQARERLLQEGDGLSQAQLQEELDSVDIAALVTQWSSLQADIEQSTQTQSDLAVQLAGAERELQAMAGADDAAQAEARRQDALARMSDAAERYVKVFTASRLLRWSIDRYREEKQGPMLARASAIFGQLTLNSFERLRVDFDRHPMVLEGQRADGHCVGIEGLSDGTRDQLYLALRLAALELHLEQAPALPFIADDLFINYDDERSEAGLRALAELSRHTQVIFLSHHEALLEPARRVFGDELDVVRL
ncbi:hypothetical protein PT7_0813 [Pusillimonas sp. T7-7]|uniref:ATP-binding protein n=1 Tax=Pusillimonas sp. (strain T7-7) TaxID=1007105 RepID=UPI00020849CB|nr:YhaN family protein [Pusillimonas sp. T7-7]AEC19353.1 hypothetical protein PT7_0813 [Pusillimonas sp. T7-7]